MKDLHTGIWKTSMGEIRNALSGEVLQAHGLQDVGDAVLLGSVGGLSVVLSLWRRGLVLAFCPWSPGLMPFLKYLAQTCTCWNFSIEEMP